MKLEVKNENIESKNESLKVPMLYYFEQAESKINSLDSKHDRVYIDYDKLHINSKMKSYHNYPTSDWSSYVYYKFKD